MKKLILLALTAMIMTGCGDKCSPIPGTRYLEYKNWVVVEIDSCEYIGTEYAYMRDLFSHKGNCRFCAERRRQETKELIDELFNRQD